MFVCLFVCLCVVLSFLFSVPPHTIRLLGVQYDIFSVDRCVSKYLEAQQLIGEVLKKANEAQAAQQQQQMELQRSMGG